MSARIIRLSRTWPALPVVYEDEFLLAVDKPAGLPVAPDRWDKQRENLMGLLHEGIRQGREWATASAIGYLSNAHRIDAETSGLLLLARTKPVLIALVNRFSRREVRKWYQALAMGCPAQDAFEIDLPIAPHPVRPGLSVIDRTNGKPAVSRVRVIERFAAHALLEVEILTGRHHQIRVHLQAAGLPLVGDRHYGGRPLLLSQLKPRYKMKADGERPLIGRPALHAWRMALRHPETGAEWEVEAPLPKDLAVGLKYLRRYAISRGAPG